MTDHDLAAACVEFDRCVNERDHAAVERVLHDDYALVLVQPAPAVVPRHAWLAMLDDYIVHAWEVEERHVDVDGDTAAVLQRVRMEATVLGQDRSGIFVISDVWRRGTDGWRVWRRHSTPLQAGVMPSS